MTDGNLKPRVGKAPLWLLPARPLRAIAGALLDGATKYAPWNWTKQDPTEARAQYGSALMRHVTAALDPTEPDRDSESALHHLAHAGACIVILIWLDAKIDFEESVAVINARGAKT